MYLFPHGRFSIFLDIMGFAVIIIIIIIIMGNLEE
jgi:hypothetical protein